LALEALDGGLIFLYLQFSLANGTDQYVEQLFGNCHGQYFISVVNAAK
jgi:hypothetical protein